MILTRPASSLEPLETRIAPAALTVLHPLPDIVAGSGKTSVGVQLGQLFDAATAHPNHTLVTFTLNFDTDPLTPGIQQDTDPVTPGDQPPQIVLEMLDDEAPLTVQNFLSYITNPNVASNFLGTFFHRASPGFVLQGGGFSAATPATHITVGPEVHNEPDIVNRSNVSGTVAMAKTAISPNTATSEWFVNVGDNSANLDAQNGGFTVFARVLSGMDLVTKITQLQLANQGSDGTGTPVQNYKSDPDHNPNTPAPQPTTDQLIKITGAQITKPQPGVVAGDYTYTIASIQDHTTHANTTLVTAAPITGSKLKLNFTPGLSGTADVTVHVTKGADSVDETFQVEVLPNLIANFATDPLPKIIAPGDTGTVVLKLTNNGAALLTKNVDVSFYLSKVGGTDTNGTNFDASDLLIGTLTNQPVSLAGGANATLSATIKVPESLVQTEGEAYRVIAKVTPTTGTITQLFTDDDNALDGQLHALVNQVGAVAVQNFGIRAVPRLVYTEADHDRVVVRLTGPGHGRVTSDADGIELAFNGTTALSTIAVVDKTAAGRAALHNVSIDDVVGTVNLTTTDINGYTTLSGGVQTLNLGNLSGDRILQIGTFLPTNSTAATISIGAITDYSLESDQPIAALTAASWHDTGGADDQLIAPSIGTLTVTGDLEASVTLEGRAALTAFTVGGFVRNATFLAEKAASVGSVTLGGMDHANFFLGTDARPATLGDFAKTRTLTSFTITGAAAAGKVFIDSQVAAAHIGAISVLRVDPASGSGPFGFVADTIASYVRDGAAPLTNLSLPADSITTGNYLVKLL